MRIINPGVVMVGVVVLAIGGWVTMPGLQGGIVEASCAQDAPGPRCIKYFTAMGNRWSSKGDYPNAVEWYSRAAEQGDVEAKFHLGWTYEAAESELTGARTIAAFEASQNGAATPAPLRDNGRDLAMLRLAEQAYLDAARDGFAPAMNNLGQLYSSEKMGAQRVRDGFGWTRRAAEAGNPVAAMNLSMAYQDGVGTARDARAAARWTVWDSAGVDARDVEQLTLMRTRLSGQDLDFGHVTTIRSAVRNGEAVGAQRRELAVDPDMPTFQEVAAGSR